MSDALGKKVSCLCKNSIHYSTESLDAPPPKKNNNVIIRWSVAIVLIVKIFSPLSAVNNLYVDFSKTLHCVLDAAMKKTFEHLSQLNPAQLAQPLTMAKPIW